MRIGNSVTRVTVRHREACRVMPNSYPEWRDFQFALNNHFGFFSCILFLRQLHLGLNMSRNVLFGSYLRCWCWNVWQKMTSTWRQNMQITSKRHNLRPDIIHESRLTRASVRRHFLALVGFMEIPVGYVRKVLSALVKIAENLFLHFSTLMFHSKVQVLV